MYLFIYFYSEHAKPKQKQRRTNKKVSHSEALSNRGKQNKQKEKQRGRNKETVSTLEKEFLLMWTNCIGAANRFKSSQKSCSVGIKGYMCRKDEIMSLF